MPVTLEFFKDAVADTQATIRAIDLKISFLLAAMIVPLAGWDKGWELLFFCAAFPWTFAYFLALFLSIGCWAFALLQALLCLNSTVNPMDHLPPAIQNRATGVFFRAGAKFSIWFNKPLPLPYTWVDLVSETNAANEYQFEHCKLCLIRDLKILRQKRAFLSFALAVAAFGLALLVRWAAFASPCVCR